MAEEICKDKILKSDRRQWSVSNKIEAEGLEWMYSDPNDGGNKETESEQYLLGKSISGAECEFRKIDALQGNRPGSLLNEGIVNATYDDTVNLLREDPLFVIKKIEAQQQHIAEKYDNVSKKYCNSRFVQTPYCASEPGEGADGYASEADSTAAHCDNHYRHRSKDNLCGGSDSSSSGSSSRASSTSRSRTAVKSSNSAPYGDDGNKYYSSRSDSVESDYKHKKYRQKKHPTNRNRKTNSTVKKNDNGTEISKNGIGPQLPLKKDSLASAFAVPNAVKAQYKTMPDIEYPHIEKRRKSKHDDDSYWSHSARMEKIQVMRSQGVNHLQRRLHGIVADELEKAEMQRYENYYNEYSQPKARKPREDKYERARKVREAARLRAERCRRTNNI